MQKNNEHIQRLDNYIGKKVYNLRLDKGLTRKEFANVIGVTQQQLHKYEKATNRISPSRLFILAQAFGLTVEYFYPIYIKIC